MRGVNEMSEMSVASQETDRPAEDPRSEEGLAPGVPYERRKRNIPVALDRRAKNAAEKRKNSERRRLIDPTTCERDYTEEELEFMKAMERYKRENRRPFPTWSEVLEVLRSLGYRRVAEPTPLPTGKRERNASSPSTDSLPPKG
jgi:ribosomal protein L25 (general stress protein Ctc)